MIYGIPIKAQSKNQSDINLTALEVDEELNTSKTKDVR